MPDTHFFSVPLAVRYGQENSVILSSLCYWITRNIQNKRNFAGNRFWTYNTLEAFQKQFPYFTVRQIRTILDNLKKSGAVVVGNFNKKAFDRTLWYSVSDEALSLYEGKTSSESPPAGGDPEPPPSPAAEAAPEPPPAAQPEETPAPICQIRQMHLSDPSNAFADSGRPIPDIIPDSLNPNIYKESAAANPANSGKTGTEAAAADSLYSDLEKAFSAIDPVLVFDRGFYPKALATLKKYGLGNGYLKWLYGFCKKKDPRDLTNYYFSVFHGEDLARRYLAGRRAAEPRTALCPVCGGIRPEFSECPSCGFSGDPERAEAAKALFNLPPDVRASYEKEREPALAPGVPLDRRLAILKAVDLKYGL